MIGCTSTHAAITGPFMKVKSQKGPAPWKGAIEKSKWLRTVCDFASYTRVRRTNHVWLGWCPNHCVTLRGETPRSVSRPVMYLHLLCQHPLSHLHLRAVQNFLASTSGRFFGGALNETALSHVSLPELAPGKPGKSSKNKQPGM